MHPDGEESCHEGLGTPAAVLGRGLRDIPIGPYSLKEAKRALLELKQGVIRGAKVLKVQP